MVKRFIKRYMPDHTRIREHKHLQFFGDRLHDPNLWHLNRRSVAGAMGMGVFIAFIPIPGQVVIAAAAAIWLRINLPLAVATVFITNPLTIPPMFFFSYLIGAWILGIPPRPFDFQLSLYWLLHETSAIWLPLLVGSLLTGALLAIMVYGTVRLAWRFHVIHRRRKSVKRSFNP